MRECSPLQANRAAVNDDTFAAVDTITELRSLTINRDPTFGDPPFDLPPGAEAGFRQYLLNSFGQCSLTTAR